MICTVTAVAAAIITIQCDRKYELKVNNTYTVGQIVEFDPQTLKLCYQPECIESVIPPKTTKEEPKKSRILLCSGILVYKEDIQPWDIVAPGGKLQNCETPKQPKKPVTGLW